MTPLLQPDRDASIQFLTWFEPAGPWCLTGIHPDDPGTPTRTFFPGEEAQVDAWLAAHAGWNVYFSVNAVRGRPAKKCTKADVAEMRWVHVDLDPVEVADIGSEQARIEALLMQDSPGGLPTPSLVTFSGGGYQAFWRLQPAVAVVDKQQAEAELEPHVGHVIQVLGGDKACRNIDRIMRLPGSVNWPNKRKRDKGRAPALARVVAQRPLSYPLDVFPKAVVEASSPRPILNGRMGATAAAAAAITLYESVDALPGFVPDALRRLILLGHDEANPTRFTSRSEACWYAICELVRKGMKDAEIEAVIRDPKFAISAHVLERKDVERYVPRQIARARELAIDPELMELNDKHAVIEDIGGKCRILGEVHDHGLDRPRISLQTFADFHNRYSNKRVKVGDKKNGEAIFEPLGLWWTRHPQRRQFSTMCFAPGQETPGAYNMWRGFDCEAREGDCSLYLEHLREVACAGDEANYEYLVRWMATLIQKPAERGHVAVVLKGKPGAGKGTVVKHLGSLLGRHYLHVSNSQHLVGNFNAHLRDCLLLFGDEAFFAGDKKHQSVLKTLVTEETMVIEKKGIDVEFEANHVHLIMASNETWTVPADLGDRRFFVLAVSDAHAGTDVAYFSAIDQQMRAGGKEALLHFLLHVDLAGFEVRKRPETLELGEEKIHTMTTEQSWWVGKLEEASILPTTGSWPDAVLCQELADDYFAHARRAGTPGRSAQVKLGLFLKKVLPGGAVKRRATYDMSYRDPQGVQHTLRRPFLYLLPDVSTCRAHWSEHHDKQKAWEPVEDYVPTPFGEDPGVRGAPAARSEAYQP